MGRDWGMTAEFTDPNLACCVDELRNFNNRIHQFLERSEWERLAETLDERQFFLENLMLASTGFSEQQKSVLKQLIEAVVDQDAECVSRIEVQKNQSSDEQYALSRGLKMLHHYKNS